MTDVRITQMVVEVVEEGPSPSVRITQMVAEAVQQTTVDIRLTQMEPTTTTAQHFLDRATEIDVDNVKTCFDEFQ